MGIRMTRKLKGYDIFDTLKNEKNRLARQLTVERSRINRAISMIKTQNPAINDDEEDDELLRAIIDLFEDYDIP